MAQRALDAIVDGEQPADDEDPGGREQRPGPVSAAATPLATATSRFAATATTSPEDLIQTARAGLIAAIDRYDPGYGTPLVPYAVACVVGELKRYLRDTSWRLHVPLRAQLVES